MRVLVANENAEELAKLRDMLVEWGYEVVAIQEGNEAWEEINQDPGTRMAILEWGLKGRPTRDICRLIRSRKFANYIFLLILDGTRGKSALVEALQAGADDFISRPFEPEELRARLKTGKRILDLEEHLMASLEVMRVQASHDSLTGILNHGMILETLEKEISRSARQGNQLGVLFADFDFFKKINDQYGHQAGDEVLAEGSRRMKKCLRPYDSLGRYGGEEFLLVLPMVTLDGLMGVAERVRATIANQPFEVDGMKLQVTTSVGVSLGEGKTSVTEMLKAADEALYRAKKGGRNQVCR
ncbi:MAG: diguanylate cyclase [Gemmataceae bacterium]|nr:diguanylate cyclase [Gemmataceae bacterium]